MTGDEVLFLRDRRQKTPDWLVPGCFHNEGNYVISLGAVTRWLAEQAEGLGVEIFPGFAAAEVLFLTTAASGCCHRPPGPGQDGEPTDAFQIGMELHAKYTVFAEGARGHLGKELIARFQLDEGRDPQTYGLGIKELWEIPAGQAKPGLVVHRRLAAGRRHLRRRLPLPPGRQQGHARLRGRTRLPEPLAESPFEEMQRWKTHPSIRAHIGAASASATARAPSPQAACTRCPGPCSRAARWSVRRGLPQRRAHQGSHAAIKSGMLCAEAAFGPSGQAQQR